MSRRTERRSQRRAPHPADHHPAASATVRSHVGGYRLLRILGSGPRSVCYLATGDEGQVVVKMRRSSDELAREDAREDGHEVECLSALEDQHIVRILDVAVCAEHPPCVVLERLDGPSLASWRREKDLVDVAEAVTIGVSVVRAVVAVHRSGWTHGAVTAANVLFDAGGCPVLIGFGGALPATSARMSADWSATATLIQSVVAGAEGATDEAIRSVRAALRALETGDHDAATAIADVESALFALGPAGPVSTAAARRGEVLDPRAAPAIARERDGAPPTNSETRDPDVWRRGSRLLVSAMERGIGTVVAAPLRRLLHGRKKAVVVAFGTAVALTVVALLTIPGPPAGRAQTPESTTATTRSDGALVTPSSSARASARSGSDPDRSSSSPGTRATLPPEPSSDDNPVRAAALLLQHRSACFARADSGCLTDVDQADSALLASDMALLTRGGVPADTPTEAQLSLTESMGDTSVIAVAPDTAGTTKPASVLVIKTEAGWRLRAVFED
ncbi:protein kinase domain-containing protein [Rathayibacter sp. CAU 1779]